MDFRKDQVQKPFRTSSRRVCAAVAVRENEWTFLIPYGL